MTKEHRNLTRTLGRLLGPAGPEVGCDVCFEELDLYVELELARRDADAAIPGVRAHLAGCPACREEHDSLYALSAASATSDRPGTTLTITLRSSRPADGASAS
jgi:hypothetical protein